MNLQKKIGSMCFREKKIAAVFRLEMSNYYGSYHVMLSLQAGYF